MPEYNAIQTSRLESWVKRLLGVRNGGILPTVAPELGLAANLPMYEDTDLLAGYLPWGAGNIVTAVVGNNPQVQLVNGFPSALLLVRWRAGIAGNSAFVVGQHGPGLGGGALLNPNKAGWRDGRRVAASFPLGATGFDISDGAVAAIVFAAIGSIVAVGLSPNSQQYVGPWQVLPPGDRTWVYSTSANVDMFWALEGFVRQVDPDELAA